MPDCRYCGRTGNQQFTCEDGSWRCTSTVKCQYRVRKANPASRAERRNMVAELTWEGWTLVEIAARLGVTTRTVGRDREKTKISRPAAKRWTEEEQRRAQELIDDGYSLMEVARTLGRHVNTIADHGFKGQGWTPEQVGQFNALRTLRKRLDV